MAESDRIKSSTAAEEEETCWLSGLQKASCEGDLESTLTLRKVYLEGGWGLEVDLQEALRYTELAARQGDPRSMYHTAVIEYSQGRFEMSARWMKKAYRSGIREACFGLARSYYYGRGVAQDPQRASEYLKEAEEYGIEPEQTPDLRARIEMTLARQDWNDGHRKQAIRRLAGIRTQESEMQLARWDPKNEVLHLLNASDLGSGKAMFLLAGMQTEPKEVFLHLRNAAKAGFEPAFLPLASCYGRGNGVSVNREEEKRWLKAAGAKEDRI